MKKGEWQVREDKKGRLSMISWAANDVNSLVAMTEWRLFQSMMQSPEYGPEKAMAFLRESWPYTEAAVLHDIAIAGQYKDGLLRSRPNAKDIIINKAWRDSGDSLTLENGDLPIPPLAHYANNAFFARALEVNAMKARILGMEGFAQSLEKRREKLVEVIDAKFWMSDQHCYSPLVFGPEPGIRLEMVTNESLIGLYVGIVPEDKAQEIQERILDKDMNTEIGSRTLSTKDPRFQIDGYHLGTVWGHMNTLGIRGARNYQLRDLDTELTEGTVTSILEEGTPKELKVVRLDGSRHDYTELNKKTGRQEPVNCKDQSFYGYGVMGIAA